MKTLDIFTSFWHFNLPAVAIAVLFMLGHWISNGYRFTKGSRNFFTGIFLMLVVTVSPLDFLGHHYLFSAHMAEHIVLLLIVPPLLLSGTSPEYIHRLMNKRWFRKTGRFLFYPVTAWILGVGSMYVWHVPSLFMSMMHSPAVMVLQMVSLLLIGLIFIWPVFAPVGWMKLSPLECALYLFSACTGCTVLGILIAFAPTDIYTSVLMSPDAAVEGLIRNGWGISAHTDQQIAGLIMWVPACLVYATNILIKLFKWYSEPDVTMEQPENRI